MPLTNAEICKNYRNRKKDATLKIKTSLTSAERSRMYRLRKKQLTQGIKSSVNEVLYTPSTSNSRMTLEPLPQPVTTVSEMSEDITQRNAQNCKQYYNRKKSANHEVVKKKTNSEKCRQYRQRKKLLAQQLQSKNEVIHNPSTSSLQMTFEPQLTTTDKGSGYLHEGCYCNGCHNDIRGFRYVCVQCPGVDLCGACEAAGLHQEHYVLRVPGRRPDEEVSSILERIQEELFRSEHIAGSIKMEFKEEPDPLLAAEDVGACAAAWAEHPETNNEIRQVLHSKSGTEYTDDVAVSDLVNKRSRMETLGFDSGHQIVNSAPHTDNLIKHEIQEIKVEVDVSEEPSYDEFVPKADAWSVDGDCGGGGVGTPQADPTSPAPRATLAVAPCTYVLEVSGVPLLSSGDRHRSPEQED